MTTLPYTPEESERASEEWKARCGHHSIAAACGVPLDAVRDAVTKHCGWMNPTMIGQALAALGVCSSVVKGQWNAQHVYHLAPEQRHILRVQFEGPWTEPGKNPRDAYRYTHYIAYGSRMVMEPFMAPWVLFSASMWLADAQQYYRDNVAGCTGYHFTHIWSITPKD